MAPMINRQVSLKSRPNGIPQADNFELTEAPGSELADRQRHSSCVLWLGFLGLNGTTAYFGLLDAGQPRPGDTVVVSTAAGAVGSAVGQIAKLSGCRTVGLTGGATKVRLCRDEFGYDAAIDYKAGKLDDALKENCPRGVD